MSKKDREFIEFLKTTLIPDLIRSGTTETAEDFKHCIRIIEKLQNK